MATLKGRLTGAGDDAYEGYRVVASYERRYEDTAAANTPPPATDRTTGGTIQPGAGTQPGASQPVFVAAQASAVVESSGAFQLDFPPASRMRFPIRLETFAPKGVRAGRAEVDARTFERGEGVELEVDPPDVFEVEPHPDPNLGKTEKLYGRVIDLTGRKQASGLQVILWARADGNTDGVPFLVARTDRQGYFSGKRPPESFASAYGTVAAGRIETTPVPLDRGRIPKNVVLGITLPDDFEEKDCACEIDVPRTPDAEELAVASQTYSQDLIGGQCVNFTVPNRTLEEFSYFQVIRTTEPEIQGLTIPDEDGPRLPPNLLTQYLPASTSTIRLAATVDREAPATLTRAVSPVALKSLASTPDRLDEATMLRAERRTAFVDLTNTLDQFYKAVPGRAPLTATNPVDWDEDPTFYQATSIAHGHLLHFKQVWKADGYSLGDLLYSLPLAPCQKKQIAVVDWERRETAARTEQLEEEEQLQAVLTRDRDISEIVNSSVGEQTRGGSQASTWAAGGGLGLAIGPLVLGAAGGGGGASSTAWQNSSRTLSASSLQQLRDRTMQAASAVRSQRSTVVQTAAQGETMRVTTEVVANHNHCHAITVEYFEVLRHFQVEHQLTDVQECLFVPLPMARFDNAKTLRWRQVLSTFCRDRSLRKGFDAIERIVANYAGSDLPLGRYSEESLLYLDGEMRIRFSIARPTDASDEFDPDRWRVIAALTNRSPSYWYDQFLRGQTQKDRIFRNSIAPRIAEAFVQKLSFALRAGSAEHPVSFDTTLVSSYDENVPLYVTLRPAGFVPGLRREDVTGFVIRSQYALTPYSQAVVDSAAVRYRTAHLNQFLFRDPRVMNDLSVSDSVFISAPLSRQERRSPRQEDREIARRLLDHLNEHLEYYHKVIWMTMDPARRYMLLDGYVAPGSGNRSVASVVENRLIGIVGNSLVMPVARGFHLDPTYRQDVENPVDLLNLYAPNTPVPPTRVSVPTRGVFAEAVMGSCNSCEVKDDTRFWRFEESPCGDEPTAILPVSTESRRAGQPDLTAKGFPAPLINLQNAPAAPDPTGLAAALGVLGTPGLFKDITGLEGNQANAIGALSKVMDTAQFFGGEASKLAMQKNLEQGMDRTLRQIQKARDQGLISSDQAKELTGSALKGLVGAERGPKDNLTDSPEVKKLLESAAGSEKSDVSLTRGSETIDVSNEAPAPALGEGQAVDTVGSLDVLEFVDMDLLGDQFAPGGLAFLKSLKTRSASFLKTLFNVRQQSSPTLIEEFRRGDAIADPANNIVKAAAVAGQVQFAVGFHIRFPADPNDVSKLKPDGGRLPVVVILHGQHDSFVFNYKPATARISGVFTIIRHDVDTITEIENHKGYIYLQDALAKAGMISISVNTNLANFSGSLVRMRAEMVFQALKLMRKFDGDAGSIFHDRLDLDANVGLVGHSRGGDAVLKFVQDNRARAGSEHFAIKAVCGIASTDFSGLMAAKFTLKSTDNLTFLGLYGSHDGDVDGNGGVNASTGTILRQYDRFTCPKAMLFFRGFTHNRFNTNWNNLVDFGDGSHPHVKDVTIPIDPLIRTDSDHQNVAAEVVTEFFRFTLKSEAAAHTLFDGTTPNTSGVPATLQWSYGTLKPVDEMETANNLLGGVRTVPAGGTRTKFTAARIGGNLIAPVIPHDTQVLQVDATAGGGADPVVKEAFPAALNLDTPVKLELLTFRIRRSYPDLTDQTVIDNEARPKFKIRILDGGANPEVASADVYAENKVAPGHPSIAKVFIRGEVETTKLVLETYRVPLDKFAGLVRTAVTGIEFEIERATTDAHVFIDSIQFVKL